MLSVAEVAARFRDPVQKRDGWWVFCPTHADGTTQGKRSLRISEGRAAPLIKCYAGCQTDGVIAAVGLTWADILGDQRPPGRPRANGGRIVATYDYPDAMGALRFQVVRLDPKRFYQRRPDPTRPGAWINSLQDVELVLYRLQELTLLRPSRVVICEGEKDVDALWEFGIFATTNAMGAGKWSAHTDRYIAQLHGFGARSIVVIPDNDDVGRDHMRTVAQSAVAGGLGVQWLDLPGLGHKEDLSDWLARGGTRQELERLIDAAPEWPLRISLNDVLATFHKWLSDEYDAEVLTIMLCAAAAHSLAGDPVWLLIISGSGAAKTETVVSLEGAGAHVVSTIASQGALLSGTAARERGAHATGGLLPVIGSSGLVAWKDLTALLSLGNDSKQSVIAALREIHDGVWIRNVGTDGGRTLEWRGRITLIAACTSAWDDHHGVIAQMGDRFLLVRIDSRHGRQSVFRSAMAATGYERQMRQELSDAVGALLATVDPARAASIGEFSEEQTMRLFGMANLAALARTAVREDRQERVVTAHAPEAPTRLAKELLQLIRGATALGLPISEGLNMAARCARDSMPVLRRVVLEYLTFHPRSRAVDIVRGTNEPRMTVIRTLEALKLLKLVIAESEELEDKTTYSATTDGITIVFDKIDVSGKSVSQTQPDLPGREPGDETTPDLQEGRGPQRINTQAPF